MGLQLMIGRECRVALRTHKGPRGCVGHEMLKRKKISMKIQITYNAEKNNSYLFVSGFVREGDSAEAAVARIVLRGRGHGALPARVSGGGRGRPRGI